MKNWKRTDGGTYTAIALTLVCLMSLIIGVVACYDGSSQQQPPSQRQKTPEQLAVAARQRRIAKRNEQFQALFGVAYSADPVVCAQSRSNVVAVLLREKLDLARARDELKNAQNLIDITGTNATVERVMARANQVEESKGTAARYASQATECKQVFDLALDCGFGKDVEVLGYIPKSRESYPFKE